MAAVFHQYPYFGRKMASPVGFSFELESILTLYRIFILPFQFFVFDWNLRSRTDDKCYDLLVSGVAFRPPLFSHGAV